MLHDIIARAVSTKPGLKLEWEGMPDEPDMMIVGIGDGEEMENIAPLLSRWPHSAVIAIEADEGEANYYELRPHRTPLGAISMTDLITLIEKKAAGRPGLG